MELSSQWGGVMTKALVGVSVLIVEDDVDSLELLEFCLNSEGATVRATDRALGAHQLLLEWHPDIIVSDISMPDEDGYTMIEKIRQNPATRMIPAIALTGNAGEAARKLASKHGFQKHLTKPADPVEIIKAVASLTIDCQPQPV